MSAILPAPFDAAPWLDASFGVPEAAERVRTMLSDEESRLLYWLARHYAEGKGEICDLGCFAGGSTARLAAGVADAGRTTPVHAYDHFRISDPQKEKFLYPAGIAPFEGEDMEHAVASLLAPWTGIVQLHKGDIRRTRWSGNPVELLFVDAAKTPQSADLIAFGFYSSLIPGRSLLIQQDYLHWRQPWVPAQMELLAECFETACWCKNGTVVFRCTRAITPEDLKAGQVSDLDDTALLGLLQQALRRFPHRPQRARLATAIMAIEDNPGQRLPYKFSNEAFSSERLQAILDDL